MYSRWTSHLKTDEEKENFKKEVYSAKRVLERLLEMVNDDEKGLSLSEMNPRSYDQASWAYHQAHKNGVRQYMNQVKTWIDLDQQKGTING
jgi:hypothetical protein